MKRNLLIIVVILLFKGLYGQSPVNTTELTAIDSSVQKGMLEIRNEPNKAISIFNELLNESKQSSDSLTSAKALNGLGLAYGAKSDYAKSLEFHYDALNYLSTSSSTITLSYVNNNIGNLYLKFNLYDDALDYFLEAERYINLNQDEDIYNFYNLLLLNISILKGRQDKNEESLRYIIEAERNLQNTTGLSPKKRVSRLAITANEKARAYFKLGRIDSALILVEKNIQTVADANSPFALGKGLFYLGDIYKAKGEYAKALFYATKADIVANSIDDLATKREIYFLVSSLYEETNNTKKALIYLKKGTKIDDEIYDVKNTWALYKLKRDIRTKEEAQQAALLEKEKKFNKKLRTLYLLLAIFSIVFAFFYFKYLRGRYQKKREQFEQLQQITEIELQKTKEVLEINKKELTSAALQIIENGETVQHFKKELDNFKQNIDKVHHKKLERLAISITNNSRKNWEEFRSRFEQVNTDFFKNLKIEHTSLSSSELKLCSFLKLNFNSKDIANLMGISPDSVKVSRYRLRKKLELERSDNLANYIDKF
ncbi:MAG: tetratricopeptide repeat protein [Bacteroidetes bacterium]|nr:tetratricopeptide repeat protein [Bacteroidota bacterium]